MTVAALGAALVVVAPIDGASAAAVPPEVPKSLIAADFPDPDVVRHGSTWYAYATNNSRHVPVASAPTIDGPWTIRGDAMPGGPSPSWARAGRTWAPDVHANPDGSLTMTYTAWHAASGRQCIGVATATNPLGPFTPLGGGPLICPTEIGGAIDANTFVDADGTRYLLWKNDGNAISQPTTLWLSRTTNNGTALVGSRMGLIYAPAGQIAEAPDMVRIGGRYVLFYSRGGYGGCGYYTAYTTATSLSGPWTPSQTLMTQANTGICGPGGADVVTAADRLTGGDKVVFHGWFNGARHMVSIDLSWVGGLPVQGGTRAVSLDGDGWAEIAHIQADGVIKAWQNYRGFAERPYGAAAIIAEGFTDPARTRFADLDDDGRAEIVHIQADGVIKAWHNDGGFANEPYGGAAIIGTGFTDPTRVRFADLDDDGRAELIHVQSDGQVRAWHNDGAFATAPYGASVIIAAGFTPQRTAFADIQTDGVIKAWHNYRGFAANPYGSAAIIAEGFTDPARTRFADLDDDGRAEIVHIQTNGELRAWHNDGGFVNKPYGGSLIVADGFTNPDRVVFI